MSYNLNAADSNKILGRKEKTMKLVDILRYKFMGNGEGVLVTDSNVSENRLFNFHGMNEYELFRQLQVPLTNGEVEEIEVSVPRYGMEGAPFMYVEYIEESNDRKKKCGYEASLDAIKNGISIYGVLYEYAFSSQSQTRTAKGLHVRNDWVIPERYIAKFEDKEYASYLSTLRGARAVIEVMTYGGIQDFMSKPCNPATVLARTGICLTSTKSLDLRPNVLKVGEVQVKYNEKLEDQIRKVWISRGLEGDILDRTINLIKSTWKECKLDGQNMIRASYLCRAVKDIGIKVSPSEIVGKLLQFRWAGVKGTAFVIADEVLDSCLKDGVRVYENIDLIVEANSWKYSPRPEYIGELAPKLEIVRFSTSRCSTVLNYQWVQALDANCPDAKERFVTVIDKMNNALRNGMIDPNYTKKLYGLYHGSIDCGMFEIDRYAMSLQNKSTKLLDAGDEIVKDPQFRAALMRHFTKENYMIGYGRIIAEGATRYVISDPTLLLRTDLMDDNMNVIITDIEQTALRGIDEAYWNNQDSECLMFRSPMVHPGEVQRGHLVSTKDVHNITTDYGVINAVSMFENIRELVVLSVWNWILEALGGASH